MLQFVNIAARNLIKSRSRTLLIGGAIGSVTALLVLLNGITAGIQDTVLDTATTLATGHVNVAGFYKLSQNSSTPMITAKARLEQLTRETVPEARLIVDRLKAYGTIISDTTSVTVPMWGVDFGREGVMLGQLPLASKRDYIENYQPQPGEPEVEGNLADLGRPGYMVLFAGHAKKLQVKVGDTVTVSMPTTRNISNTKDLKVAAVLKTLGMMSSFTVFLNHEDVRALYQVATDATGQLMVYLRSADQTPVVEERLRKAVARAGFVLMDKDPQAYWMKFDRVSGESWTGQKIDITTWQDETSFVKWILDLLHAMTYVFTFVLLVIVVAGLVNTLWMSIRERTGEIGTLRAIGLQRRQVLGMFAIESFLLASAGSIAGILVGLTAAGVVNLLRIPIRSESFTVLLMADRLKLSMHGGDLLAAFLLITGFLLLGSLYPAYKASRMKPITAMNHID